MVRERQSDWAYLKPVVILDMLWNLASVAVSATVLVLSREEKPNVPLRVLIIGYALQSVLHMICLTINYRRRRRRRLGFASMEGSSRSDDNSSSGLTMDSAEFVRSGQWDVSWDSNTAKHVESAYTVLMLVWWVIGIYWVSAGGQALSHSSPQLYRLCIFFLGFDIFFVFFCVALPCVIGIAVCCCLPCIIAILYAVVDQDGASKGDMEELAKYKFRRVGDSENISGDEQVGGVMTECGTDSPLEHALLQEDVECCICLSAYDDGVELRELPCGHHFHCACVDKWLYINATCPLCKYNILKTSGQDTEAV